MSLGVYLSDFFCLYNVICVYVALFCSSVCRDDSDILRRIWVSRMCVSGPVQSLSLWYCDSQGLVFGAEEDENGCSVVPAGKPERLQGLWHSVLWLCDCGPQVLLRESKCFGL